MISITGWSGKIAVLIAVGGYWLFSALAAGRPEQLVWWGIGAVIMPLLAAELFFRRLRRMKIPSANLRWPLAYLVTGGFLLAILVEYPALRQMLVIVNGLMIFLDLYFLDLFTRHSSRYPTKSLEQINLAIIVLSLFYLFSVLSGWVTFLANIFWPAMLLSAVLACPLYWRFLSLRQTEGLPLLLAVTVLNVVTVELFWSLSLWPLGFIVRGWEMGLLAAGGLYLTQTWFAKRWPRPQTTAYLAIGAVLAVAAVIFARWL